MKSQIYFRSIDKSVSYEEFIHSNIVGVVEKFTGVSKGDLVVRLSRIKGGDIFRFPRFMCEVLLTLGNKTIIIKKKSADLRGSILDSRFALEKSIRRKLKRNRSRSASLNIA